MSIKSALAGGFRSILTMISPMLNTKVTYSCKFKRKLDLNNPQTLNEKILWLKFNTYWNNPTIKQCADKYRVREYIENKGMSEVLNSLLGVYEKPEDINWLELPKRFAIKLNVGSGCNIIVRDKNELNIEEIEKTIRKWLKSNYYLGYSEMQYKDVRPYILIEEYLGKEDGALPEDYKFYCMNGKSMYVMICAERENGDHAKYFYYDKNWNLMPYSEDALREPDYTLEKPENIDLAFEYAEKLSSEFPFVRCDLYIVRGKVYFGEFTFTPSAGMDVTRLKETDYILGEQLELPKK